jgi:hypothetical protein
MSRYTDDVTARWQDGGIADMLVEMRRVALLILAGTIFGVELGPRLDELWPSILAMLEYISPGLWIVVAGRAAAQLPDGDRRGGRLAARDHWRAARTRPGAMMICWGAWCASRR